MKRTIIAAGSGLVVLVLAVLLLIPQCAGKRALLGGIGSSLLQADSHQLAILETGGRAATASHNLEVIARASELIASPVSGTSVYREIVRVAADADHECPRLGEVLDLAVAIQSEMPRIVALAEAACALETPDQEAAWQAAFDQLAAERGYVP